MLLLLIKLVESMKLYNGYVEWWMLKHVLA